MDSNTKKVPVTIYAEALVVAGIFSEEDKISGANFSQASMIGSSMQGTNLSLADFSRADLREMNFRDCDLRGANFSDALLIDAQFHGADLRGAIITQEQLNSADGDYTTRLISREENDIVERHIQMRMTSGT